MTEVTWAAADVTDGSAEAAPEPDAGVADFVAATELADLGTTAEVMGAAADVTGDAIDPVPEPVTGVTGLGVATGVAGGDVTAEVTGAAADVTEPVTEPGPELVTGAAGAEALTGGGAAEMTDGGGDVAACACRENTSRTISIPADTSAACIARRAMCSNVAWDTDGSPFRRERQF